MAYLVLVRHGQSEWNALGLWTGWTDVSLTEQGRVEARSAAGHLRDISFHKAHTSQLKRTQETMDEIKHALQLTVLETFSHPALSERNYGDYTGKNKWDVKAAVGDEEFARIRRSWEVRVPGGESLHDVHDRVILYFEQHILTDLQAGKNIIVVSSGNTLRALVKYLDTIPDDKIHELEIGTGEVFVYDIAEDGSVISKQIRAVGGKA
jgi:2,3-bisphosphoglycerate-dependent phosphoglycerate mutase